MRDAALDLIHRRDRGDRAPSRSQDRDHDRERAPTPLYLPPLPPWGHVDPDLLDDRARYGAYAWAHHVAGHHWALWDQEVPLVPAGLDLGLPPMDAETRAEVEASAVLVEALGVEYAVEARRFDDFGMTVEDVDFETVCEHIRGCAVDAAERGCEHSDAVLGRLHNDLWLRQVADGALRSWDEVSALAGVLGSGRILERDEVARMLVWW